MPKKKERNSDEYFRGIIRELKKEIRQLQQQLRQYEKYSQDKYCQEETIVADNEDTYVKLCDACGKGSLKEIDIIGRIFTECSVCGEKKKVK